MSVELLPGIDVLKSLGLSVGTYLVFGSGPLVVRGMRSTQDLDVLVTNTVFEELLAQYPDALTMTNNGDRKILLGVVEVCDTCPGLTNQELQQALLDPDIVEGIPFLKLGRCIQSKRFLNREKDKKDILMITEYLQQGGI